MKKILLITPFLLAFSNNAAAQCSSFPIPYTANADAATPPALPECMDTNYYTFASVEVFETLAGPVPGYTGNVFVYDTYVEEMGFPQFVDARLYTPSLQLIQGVSYVLSYRYGNSDPSKTIDNMYVNLNGGVNGNTQIALHTNITGASPENFVSEPFTVTTTGIYSVSFKVNTAGAQGLFYLDDIRVAQQGTSGLNAASMASVKVYPNPAGNTITLTGNTEINKVEFFSATGQKVLTQAFSSSNATLNIESLSAGIYIVTVQSVSGSDTLKLIKT